MGILMLEGCKGVCRVVPPCGLRPPPGGLAGDVPTGGSASKLQTPPIGLTVTFTNRFDAYYLLGKVFWCGCEFIAFTTHNIFTNFDCVFPTRDGMHTLPYYIGEDGMERSTGEEVQ